MLKTRRLRGLKRDGKVAAEMAHEAQEIEGDFVIIKIPKKDLSRKLLAALI